MGTTLGKITTHRGDKGTTTLGDGTRLDKDSPRIEAVGSIDELNSWIGLMLAETLPETVRSCLTAIQHDLFDLGMGLSHPGKQGISEDQLVRLDMQVETFNRTIPRLNEFILPGGSRAASVGDVARGVCRKTERRVVSLSELDLVPELAIPYINRLSDMLFVLSRLLNKASGQPDVLWKPPSDRG
jgi:cob(I)alamin adenosyltransferase